VFGPFPSGANPPGRPGHVPETMPGFGGRRNAFLTRRSLFCEILLAELRPGYVKDGELIWHNPTGHKCFQHHH
jgi:hypothetical protein